MQNLRPKPRRGLRLTWVEVVEVSGDGRRSWKVSVSIFEKYCCFVVANRIYFAFIHLSRVVSTEMLGDRQMMLELFEVDELKTVSAFVSFAIR